MNTVLNATTPTGAGWNNTDTRLVRLLIIMSVTFALMPSNLSWGTPDPEGNYAEGSLFLQVEFGSVFLLGAWLAWRNRGWSLRHVLRLNPLLVVMILYCFASMLWSAYPIVTLKRSVELMGLTLVGIAISPPVASKQQLLRTLLGTLMGLMVISFFVALLLPSIGVDYELGGAWRGILSQKNALGAIAGLSVMLWLKESLADNIPRPLCYLGILFCLFMLVMAKSSTSILVALLGSAIFLLLRRRYMSAATSRQVFLALLFVVLLGLYLFYLADGRLPDMDELISPITGLFNKGSDLTGRTDIWNLVGLEITRHIAFGIGYGAFWLGEGSRSQFIIDALHWIPLQAHNGYLDIVNELGVVGFVIMLGVFLVHMRNLLKMTAVDREEAAVHWALLFLILISNLSESEMFRGILFQNILLLYSITAVSARLTMHRVEMTAVAS